MNDYSFMKNKMDNYIIYIQNYVEVWCFCVVRINQNQ